MKHCCWCLAFLAVLGAIAQADTGAELAAAFKEAQSEYSPVPIWWWSGDRIVKDQIKTQLERMADGGIYNVIVLNLAPSGPLYGSAADDPPFLTEEWWALFTYALSEAKRLGIRMWFYDQLGFSGAGLQARVVRNNPAFRGITLHRVVRDVEGPADVVLETPPGGEALAAFTALIDTTKKEKSERANWIWDKGAGDGTYKRYFRRHFDLIAVPEKARVHITCDNGYTLYVNGEKIGEESIYDESGWRNAENFDVAPYLRSGENTMAVMAENLGGAGGLLVEIFLDDGVKPRYIISDNRFRVSDEAAPGWELPDYDDRSWKAAHVLGPPPLTPWGPVHGLSLGAEPFFGTPLRRVQNISSAIENGILKTETPLGKVRVQLFYTMPGGFDYQNPDAAAALMDIVHGEMARRFPDELGKSIAGSFQDEFPALPRFSRRMLTYEFAKHAGYDLKDHLPALFDDVTDHFGVPYGPTTAQVRCDAADIAALFCEEAFFIPLFDWHDQHGMICGYDQTVRNADPIRGEQYYINYFKTMRHYGAPGNDMDGDIKPHQSIADLYGRPRVWMEAFHSSGWGQTIEETAVLLHPWVLNGATLFNPHAIYYSIHGSYWEWAPPDTGWRQPYFAHYKGFADYVARLSYLLSEGAHAVETAVLHPSATVHAYMGFGEPDTGAVDATGAYWAIQRALQQERLDYIIIDDDSILRARVRQGVLELGDIQLRTLILPAARVLRGKTLEKIMVFMNTGGQVVIVGPGPEIAADRRLTSKEFTAMAQVMQQTALMLPDLQHFPAPLASILPRCVDEQIPALHRRVADRDIFFLLSDEGTAANAHARYAINSRKLYETQAARGARMQATFRGDGVPEYWNALTGEVTPIWNYRRGAPFTPAEPADPPSTQEEQPLDAPEAESPGGPPAPESAAQEAPQTDTGVQTFIELAATPAPLVVLRPATAEDPIAIESDLEITSWTRQGDAIVLRGWPRLDATAEPLPAHHARMELEDAVYEGASAAASPARLDLEGPFPCRLLPTCENHDGSFAWPPAEGVIPVEIRTFRHRLEHNGDDAAAWIQPDFDDSAWDAAIASFGPRAQWTGPLSLPEGADFANMPLPEADAASWQEAVYSLRLGINEDPVFASALGGKGRIPDEFIDLGDVAAGAVYCVRATVILPENIPGTADGLDTVLRVGSAAQKRVFINGQEAALSGGAATIQRAAVRLQPGVNRLDVLLARAQGGRLRCFYHFLPPGAAPDDPDWIWSAAPNPSGKTRFVKRFEVPGAIREAAMVAALGGLHQIRINGQLVADQGNFDPYFTSRAERYDIAPYCVQGDNVLEIEAPDAGHPVGLLLDALVTLEDDGEVVIVSNDSFLTMPPGDDTNEGVPARILAGPATGYMGDPANLLLRPRPHPLPEGGWLLNQPVPQKPFNALVYAATPAQPAPGWFRFLLPPGATALTLHAAGAAQLYVDGESVELTDAPGQTPANQPRPAQRALLPQPEAPSRMAALRIDGAPGFGGGAALLAPIAFEMGEGRIALGSWDELGLPHYAGGIAYTCEVTLDAAPTGRAVLDLGRVRGSVDVRVNSEACGERAWHPYRFDLAGALRAGSNQIEVRVFNTLGPHFGAGHPSAHVFEGHTQSGIYGPIALHLLEPVELRLKKVK